ncbi:MAG: transglutaminase family protein [Drouetiella hepatica Uher 2000/2452]|uniref:Transglutaminase family protein n=1 Tax=Drouetiella hepatica Uher 2000/2452 TaxID=904376 RepID=A0A951QDL4_9CYAN|nr:transglutaminase family protein [Drouetiella hepatica Uher 2000/2452]
MRYQITHTTFYSYDRPVLLSPHIIRLRPRCDVQQKLHSFSLQLDPPPKQMSENVDLDGNAILKAWFTEEPIAQFTLEAISEVETLCHNPFVYMMEPWAVSLPMDYPSSILSRLQSYLQPYWSNPFSQGAIDPEAMMLAQDIWQATNSTTAFLNELNQRIYKNCGYGMRETGSPLPPGITWRSKQGSCRDYAVLFMEVCRAVGIASRFVSGYQEGDPDSSDRHLHAWAEVYLPGAGWRGYDPTHGLVVSDRHIPLIASASAEDTAPVSGKLKTLGVNSSMRYELFIKLIQD